MGSGELDPGASSDCEPAGTAGSDVPDRVGQPGFGQRRGEGPGDTGPLPDETRTREEYARQIRYQGEPIPSGGSSSHGPAPAAEHNSHAGEPGGRDDAADLAKSSDRGNYADDMGAGAERPVPDQAAVDGQETEAAGAGSGTLDGEPAGPPSRADYADIVRNGLPCDSRQPELPARSNGDAPAARHDAGQMAERSPDQASPAERNPGAGEGGRSREHANDVREDIPGKAISTADQQDTALAGGLWRENAPPSEADARGGTSTMPGQGTGDQRGLSSATDTSGLSDAARRPSAEQAGYQPQKVMINGKIVEITHNMTDGIWIEGLPGEIPRRIGDVITDASEDRHARSDRFLRKAVEEGDDLIDSADKAFSLGHDALQRPPVHTEMPVSVPGSAHEVPHHEIEAGSVATAIMAAGMLFWAAGQWVHRRMRGLDDARDR